MGGLWLLSGRAAPQSPLAPAPEPAELAADAQAASAVRAAAAASGDARQRWGGDGAVAGAEPGGGGDGSKDEGGDYDDGGVGRVLPARAQIWGECKPLISLNSLAG
jgi:hypothetical protein